MKTHTVQIDPNQKPVEVCNSYEDQGWGVRQIVNDHTYGTTYIVFEKDDDSMAYMPAPRSFTGSEVPTLTAQAQVPKRYPARSSAGRRG